MIAHLMPYPAMKDSGFSWLGKVPEHWRVAHVRRYCRVFAGATPSRVVPEYWTDGEIPWLASGDVNLRRIGGARQFITELGHRNSSTKWIRPGSLVLALAGQGRTKGMVATVEVRATCNQSLAVIEPNEDESNYEFLAYYLESRYMAIRALVGDDLRDGLNLQHVKSIPTPVPPLPEQAAIVRYLDHVDRRVSRLVRTKRRFIALVTEQKQAIIHRAVTRGLDPNTPLKDSGVEWLGEVPKHWEVLRTKYVFKEVDQRSTTGEETHLSMSQKLGLVPSDLVQSTLTSESYVGGKLCEVEDLVLNRLKAHLGVFALAKQPGVISSDYSVFRGKPPTNVKYFELALRSPACRRELRIRAKGIVEGFWRLYTDDFYDIRVPVPPPSEQDLIVAYIDKATAEIDIDIARASVEIELLDEYRTRLIADVVTGKLDARDAAAALTQVDHLDLEDGLNDDLVLDSQQEVDDRDPIAERTEA